MSTRWKVLAACSVAGLLVIATGCGGGSQADSQADSSASGTDQQTQDAEGAAPGKGKAPLGRADAQGRSRPAAYAPPTVLIDTSVGEVTVELNEKEAPITVDNFLGYVETGFYDATIIHEVFPDEVILGGSLTKDFSEKEAGPEIRNEADNGLKNVRGSIAMVRQHDAIDSATCQFFINVKDNPNYDHQEDQSANYDSQEDFGYCVFGKVIDGFDVVERIAGVKLRNTQELERTPVQTVMIKSIRRVR